MSLSRSKEKLIGRLRSRRMRPREGLVLIEGLHTCVEAVDAGARIRFAVASRSLPEAAEGRRLAEHLEATGVVVEWVGEEILASVSDTESPQGLLLVCEAPAVDPAALLSAPDGRFLLLDGVQDPGNLGTLVRAARAFALHGAIALDGTV
ncbi:MAG: RNA methyltransferase, partial [Gemmatimonadetes bacterium]|nr:RNA methyltransferase [Gemmatimonadota bacterium]NIV82396.1 RNA methyltransferase [Gemmatimonadota bacterium]NIX46367.1 RNA methyltransferase [Gemmatimonadota bacterium]NIY10689.1 RNA methyltransferase [Gemmatimonadota bacterium]